MKKALLLFVVFCFAYTTRAQISDRENDNSTYLLGARPVQGNFGFYFGYPLEEIEPLFTNYEIEQGIPIINVKYYYTDKLVLKGGIRVWKKRRSIDGDFDSGELVTVPHYNELGEPVPYLPLFETDPLTGDLVFDEDPNSSTFGQPIPILDPAGNQVYGYSRTESIKEYKHVETEALWNINAGIEQHFDLSNIIDAYVGINGNFGYEREVQTRNVAWEDGDYDNNEGSSFGITYGAETIIGINCFIADLPIALGFEYGAGFRNYGANKFKYQYDEQYNTGTISQTSASGTYYVSQVDDFQDITANSFASNNVQFANLKAKRFDVGHVARVTLTYYLKR